MVNYTLCSIQAIKETIHMFCNVELSENALHDAIAILLNKYFGFSYIGCVDFSKSWVHLFVLVETSTINVDF